MDFRDVLLSVLSVLVAFLTYVNVRRKETKNEGAQEATLHADLRYIKELLQDVRSDMKEITKSVDAHSEKIAKCEEQLHSAFTRIERLEKQFDGTKES